MTIDKRLASGTSARDLVLALPALIAGARRFRFIAYSPTPGFAERSRTLPKESAPDDVAKEAVRHDSMEATAITVAPDDLNLEWINQAIGRLKPGQVLGLTSRCEEDGAEESHIPMMDFRVAPGDDSLQQIKVALRILDQDEGAILQSGRSYHYYGFTPLGRDPWLRFMARSLLLESLADVRYIAHRLLSNAGVLRITANQAKPVEPTIVASISKEPIK